MGSTSRGIVLRAGTRIGHTACVSMSAADVFKRMLRDEVAAALRATGLRGSGATYLMRSASHWALLGFQGSTANSAERMKFTVNCTVVRKDTWAAAYAGAAVHRREAEAEVRAGVGWCARLGAWMPDGRTCGGGSNGIAIRVRSPRRSWRRSCNTRFPQCARRSQRQPDRRTACRSGATPDAVANEAVHTTNRAAIAAGAGRSATLKPLPIPPPTAPG